MRGGVNHYSMPQLGAPARGGEGVYHYEEGVNHYYEGVSRACCAVTVASLCSSSRRRHAAQNVWPHGKSSVGRRSLPLMSSRQIPHLNARARAPGSGARKREGASEAPRLHCGDHAATALL